MARKRGEVFLREGWYPNAHYGEDHDIYNEEEKLIGKYENCDGNQVAVKRKSDNKH